LEEGLSEGVELMGIPDEQQDGIGAGIIGRGVGDLEPGGALSAKTFGSSFSWSLALKANSDHLHPTSDRG
jgi:hypothetical protein